MGHALLNQDARCGHRALSLADCRAKCAMTLGVTCIVCCYNSASRLPTTLAHLAAQRVPEDIPWEVLVVDNNSTDNTIQVATTNWPRDFRAPLSIVSEPRQGLSFARLRGVQESHYPIVTFIDDDNWVCPEWVALVHQKMISHPEIGALGGMGEPVFEIPPAPWFETYKHCYAVGSQAPVEGDVSCTTGYLWGAGLTMRKAAFDQLESKGFKSLLSDRQGDKLMGGGDLELSYALHFIGWQLWYDPLLRYKHFLPSNRLEWVYLRKWHRAAGATSLGLDPYRALLDSTSHAFRGRMKRCWFGQACLMLVQLFRKRSWLLRDFPQYSEGNNVVLSIEEDLGRFFALLGRRALYDRSFD